MTKYYRSSVRMKQFLCTSPDKPRPHPLVVAVDEWEVRLGFHSNVRVTGMKFLWSIKICDVTETWANHNAQMQAITSLFRAGERKIYAATRHRSTHRVCHDVEYTYERSTLRQHKFCFVSCLRKSVPLVASSSITLKCFSVLLPSQSLPPLLQRKNVPVVPAGITMSPRSGSSWMTPLVLARRTLPSQW